MGLELFFQPVKSNDEDSPKMVEVETQNPMNRSIFVTKVAVIFITLYPKGKRKIPNLIKVTWIWGNIRFLLILR